jgi:putative copper resistance protein D
VSLVGAQVVVAWFALVVVAGLYGGALFGLLVRAGAGPQPAPVRTGLARLYRVFATLALVLVPIGLLVAIATTSGTSLGEALGLITTTMRETQAGRLWGVRVVLTLALFSAAWMPLESRAREGAIAVLGALWLLARAMVSHAVDAGPLAVAVYAVHMLAAGLWFGAIVAFTFGASQMGGPEWVAVALQRLWRVTAWCAAVVVLSGFLVAYGVLHLNFADLGHSRYGHTLVAKITLFTIVVGYGAYVHHRRARSVAGESNQFDVVRAIGINVILLIGVIEFAALLAHIQPPH